MAGLKKRTTVTLSAVALKEASRIAARRQVTLSTVIDEALAQSLSQRSRKQKAREVLDAYSDAFAGLSEEQLMMLDGVDWEPRP